MTMKQAVAAVAAFLAVAVAPAAEAAISSVLGGAVPCVVQTGGDAGERHCAGIFHTFDGAPIDVNVGFPPAPAAGPDGQFPIIGVFHGWGGTKLSLTSASMQEWLDRGYAVFSMSDRGWGGSCGALDPKLLTSECANGYNHLMDTRYEVRDAQEVFEALADQPADGAPAGEGLIDPQAIGATGSSYGGGISMALGALRDRKMLGGDEGGPTTPADGHLAPWVSPGGKAMRIAATQPDIPWTDLAYALTPNGHTLDYVADAPYLQRGRIGVPKTSFVAGLYGTGLASSNYAPPGVDPDADLTVWFATVNAGEPYDGQPLAADIVDETTRHHSSYYVDDSTAPAPMLISNGWTDDLFPADEAIRFYNRTRTRHPGTPIALIFTDHGHQRGQNKGPDAAFLDRERQAWFDFYVKGTGAPPFLGVQTLTQVCGGPSGGASGDFDDPDVDLPFQASSWAKVAPGEVRFEESAPQVIAPDVPSDAPVGQAFDPITGPGACATASAADQTGTATYRLDAAPAGGFTLMGSPTVIADILSPGATSQVAARLLDVDPASGEETLVARGLYRPEITPLEATRQVFQLHPNGWHFAAGHVAKLELLPADEPYGRNSNGQEPVTISNLELRLPVREAPDCGLVQYPAAKVLPPDYALAADFLDDAEIGCGACPLAGCAAPVVASASRLLLKDRTPDAHDKLAWKLRKGPLTDPGDFGDPLATTGYALCAYDGAGNLLLHASAPAGGTCAGRPCWKATKKGFRYVDRALTLDGIQKIDLKGGDAGRSALVVTGKGDNLAMPPLPVASLPVTVQLVAGTGRCWETTFSTTQRNLPDQLKAKSD
jgi:predicted acyl esterase